MDSDATWYGGRPRPVLLPPQKGAHQPIHFSALACLLWPNGWIHQDATWYGGRPQPRGLCVRWGPSPLPKRGKARGWSPQFSAHVYCGRTAGWIKMALSMEACLGPGHIVLDADPVPLPKKGAEPPNFRPIFIVAKRLDASRCHLVRR